ncbi:hypothetical protein GEMRC1_001686 [Eukaryota sp. GEM-RC1]
MINQLRKGLEHGSRLSDYDICTLLGKGAFSHVFHGRSKHTGQDVAIKVIDKKAAKVRNLTHRITNETHLHSRLHHPHVVDLYAFSEDQNSYYIILEYCNAGNLYSYLHNSGRLRESLVQDLSLQLIKALLYLHSHNIIHRDIKLSNILLSIPAHGPPILKLGDFGLALLLDSDEAEADTVCGTLNYLAPEISSQQSYGKPSDRWALGCIIFAMLTGGLPFVTSSSSPQSYQLNFPPHVSASAQDLVSKLLTYDPHHRISLDKVLTHPFFTPQPPSSTYSSPSSVYRPASRLSAMSIMSPLSVASTPLIKKKDPIKSFLRPLSTTNVRAYTHKAKMGQAIIDGPGESVRLIFDGDGSMFSVSGDGREITVVKRKNNEEEIKMVYEIAELPQKFHRKYLYAANFVSLVAQRTTIVDYTSPYGHFSLTAGDTFLGKLSNNNEFEIKGDRLDNLSSFPQILLPLTSSVPPNLCFDIKQLIESWTLCKNLATSTQSDLPITVVHPQVIKNQGIKNDTITQDKSPPVPVIRTVQPSFEKIVFQKDIGWAFRFVNDQSVHFAFNDGVFLKLEKNGNELGICTDNYNTVTTINLTRDHLPSEYSSKMALMAPLLSKNE